MIHRRSLALAVLLSLPGTALAQAPAPLVPVASSRFIRVGGEGRVSVRPDVAVLFTGVESTGKDLARVTREANAQMRRVVAALGEAGVPEKDVQTARHDIQVERPWNTGRPGPITGYTVSDEVRVTVRDLAQLGAVIDRVTTAGANALRSLSFQKDDPTPERARALVQAYAAARAKAQALAQAAGVTLGEVLSVSESVQRPPVPIPMMAARAEAGPSGAPVSPGEVEVSASVEVLYAIR